MSRAKYANKRESASTLSHRDTPETIARDPDYTDPASTKCTDIHDSSRILRLALSFCTSPYVTHDDNAESLISRLTNENSFRSEPEASLEQA